MFLFSPLTMNREFSGSHVASDLRTQLSIAAVGQLVGYHLYLCRFPETSADTDDPTF
jgi:hypothetical protein